MESFCGALLLHAAGRQVESPEEPTTWIQNTPSGGAFASAKSGCPPNAAETPLSDRPLTRRPQLPHVAARLAWERVGVNATSPLPSGGEAT